MTAYVYMIGPPKAVAENAYTDGPSTWWKNLQVKTDQDIIVVKNRKAQTVGCFEALTGKSTDIPASHELADEVLLELPGFGFGLAELLSISPRWERLGTSRKKGML